MKAGVVAIVGRPNVGKSSLLNALSGRKISMVSSRPASTRIRVHGIITDDSSQVVLVDTPGFDDPRTLLDGVMSQTVQSALGECDSVLFVIDARGWTERDQSLLDVLRRVGKPVVLAMNKVDLIRQRDTLLPVIDRSRSLFDFVHIVPVSATTGANLAELRPALQATLPDGDLLFPADAVTNLPEKYYLAEVIREKVFSATFEEVPQTVAVEVEDISPGSQNPEMQVVRAVIYVERENLKAMIIGRGGARIKQIGRAARVEMEEYFGRRVFLELTVRTAEHWRNRPDVFRRFGYGAF